MRRILFLVTARSGSTFLATMLLGRPGNFADGPKAFGKIDYPVWLNTVPEKQCHFYYAAWPDGHIIQDLIKKRPVIETPEAYSWLPPANLNPSFYQTLPAADWRFVYLFRDPRGRIQSHLNRTGWEGEKNETLFRKQCDISRCLANSAVPMLHNKRFFFLRFEDLIAKPIETLVKMFRFTGFEIDTSFYENLIQQWNTGDYCNSAHIDRGKGSLMRWGDWPEEWVKYYQKEVNPGLKRLGFDEYLEW